MRLICPNCASQYEVDGSLFPPEGREVQCSNCEESWIQYPQSDEPPLRLDPAAAAGTPPPRPSERLDRDERAALSQAVRGELDARDGKRPATDFFEPEDGESEEDILAALRSQIAEEGGDFEKGEAVQSQRRNLTRAAESAGIDIDDATTEEKKSSRWGFNMDDTTAEDTAPATGLAAALRELEKVEKPSGRAARKAAKRTRRQSDPEVRERRGSMMPGFVIAVVLIGLVSAAYVMRADIETAYPAAAPYLAQMSDYVATGRLQVEELYVQYQPVAEGLIAQASETIEGFTSGEDAPAAE
ncbi:MAG: zinc-ribbon domain-containing protein [Pseudomonadota bacterium]